MGGAQYRRWWSQGDSAVLQCPHCLTRMSLNHVPTQEPLPPAPPADPVPPIVVYVVGVLSGAGFTLALQWWLK